VRARNSAGPGPWSPSRSFTTLPSLYVPDDAGTGWRTAVPHMVVNGAWVPVQMSVPDGTASSWV
jgi:hypothetical protein